MPIVNYVREHIRFIEYASDEKLSSSERLLWYALMHVMNQRAEGNVWPDDFVRISNERLLSLCPLKFDTMASARNKLKQRGLIEVEPGDKNKKSPAYRMIYFFPTPSTPPSDQGDGGFYPNFSDNMGDNVGGNMGYNMGDNVGGNMGYNAGDIYINNIQGHIPYANKEREEDDETNTISIMRARASIRMAWKNAFGSEPTPSILYAIMERGLSTYELDIGMILEAIKIAGLRGASDPLAYVTQLFEDWHSHQIWTIRDLERYLIVERNRA